MLWGTTQLAAWDHNVAFKEPGRLWHQQQGTVDGTPMQPAESPTQPAASPGCSCSAEHSMAIIALVPAALPHGPQPPMPKSGDDLGVVIS